MIRVGLVEDNVFLAKSVQDSLRNHDSIKIKFWAKNGREAISYLESENPVDVLLMDLEMPVMSGIEATQYISTKFPHIRILVSTVFDDDDNLFRAIRAGAHGYLLKDEPTDVLTKALSDILEGGAPMSAGIASKTLRLLRDSPQQETEVQEFYLTARETEVLEQLCTGLSYQQIADNLIISPKTVRKHIENVYQKLNVHSKVEAVNVARKNRLI